MCWSFGNFGIFSPVLVNCGKKNLATLVGKVAKLFRLFYTIFCDFRQFSVKKNVAFIKKKQCHDLTFAQTS
jgi:hypothetical protein